MRAWVVCFLLAASAVATSASAQWSASGVPVCTANGPRTGVALVSDGHGGTIVGWSDYRFSTTSSEVYLSHVDSTGAVDPAWPSQGLLVSPLAGSQVMFDMRPDQQGGAFVVWGNGTSIAGSSEVLYLQRITSAGIVAAGWPADGVQISPTAAYGFTQCDLESDGAGGVYVSRTATGVMGLFVHRFDADGQAHAGWPVGGVHVGNNYWSDPARIIGIPAGGCYAVWTEPAGTRAIRLSGNGSVEPGWPGAGSAILGDNWLSGTTEAVLSDDGGLLTACDAYPPEAEIQLFQKVTASGAPLWGAGGWWLDLEYQAPWLDQPQLVADGAGGLFASWRRGYWSDPRAATWEVWLMHLDASGNYAPGWTAPRRMGDTTGAQFSPRLVPDGAGGVYAGWLYYRNRGWRYPRFAVQRLSAEGQPAAGWDPAGVHVCTSDSGQASPVLINDGNGVIAAWVDYRNNPTPGMGVYVQRFRPDGTIPVVSAPPPATMPGVRLVVGPNPTRGPMRISLTLARGGRTVLELLDLSGRLLATRDLGERGAGSHVHVWDVPGQRPGVYWLRARGAGESATRRVAILR